MKRAFLFISLLAACYAALISNAHAKDREICVYVEASGSVRQVNSLQAVPPKFRASARCFAEKQNDAFLDKPENIKLEGTVRKEEMTSSIGRISLRWPRKVEVLFGRTPQRAVADAATTASRALKASGFTNELRTLNRDWSIVFMDEELPETQIPMSLVSNCHPAWMTPPANIYVVAQRAAAGCSGQKVTSAKADSELTHILLHEIGHSIEHQILKEMQSYDRVRGEGFATWFEQYASDYSSILRKGELRDHYVKLAKQSYAASPVMTFGGTAHDYARASMYFHAIVERRGVASLMKVYDVLASERMSFFAAVEKALNWNQKRLEQEVARLLE